VLHSGVTGSHPVAEEPDELTALYAIPHLEDSAGRSRFYIDDLGGKLRVEVPEYRVDHSGVSEKHDNLHHDASSIGQYAEDVETAQMSTQQHGASPLPHEALEMFDAVDNELHLGISAEQKPNTIENIESELTKVQEGVPQPGFANER